MGSINRAAPAVIGKEMYRQLRVVMLATIVMIGVILCGAAEGQTFSDNFNRPDGAVGNGWSVFGAGASLAGGQLRTIGTNAFGGGIFRNLTVTFPVTFSFDFSTANPADGGWFIAFNAVSTLIPGPSPAQISFLHESGSRNILRVASNGFEAFPILPGQENYGAAPAHIQGHINADLSTVITVTYADGVHVTANFGPTAPGPIGPMFVLGNSNASFGPDFFDNLQIGSCVKPDDVIVFAGPPYSLDLKFTSENATFTPTDTGGILPVGLDAAARACGFTGFNWQNQIDSLPGPSSWFPFTPSDINPLNLSSDGSMQAPPSFSDPPRGGGYTYENGTDFAYPFYWDSSELANGHVKCIGATPIETIDTLAFQDCPADSFLPLGQAVKFTTSLVGVLPSGMPSAPLFTWKWESTFNGLNTGGASQSKSILPTDPTSGTGGVTTTSINGIPQTPLLIKAFVTPSVLWPPNGEMVNVTVAGGITGATSGVRGNSVNFAVADEYGSVQPSGSVTLGANGTFVFSIALQASRLDSDQDGRTYTITIIGQDNAGNQSSISKTVLVPHDQPH